MPALAFETECRSDQQIASDFLSYLQSESSDRGACELEPPQLTGGFDARLYRYKLVGQEPTVLCLLNPEREAEELVIHRLLGDQSILGESMNRMHELHARPIVEAFRRAGVPDERFL